ncbi:hypothetical protein R3P38DRAFT_2818572 [Favolaschia claudopus]|uniref:Uncharacterized protein n=1 Tax=Favolaschia claudopus TaxID=2862362 RepID=A0AAW0ECP7_9AGAR
MPVLSLERLSAMNTAKHPSPWRKFQEQLANFSSIPPVLPVPQISIPPVPPVSIPHVSIPPISIPHVSIPPISIPHVSPVTFPAGFPFASTPQTALDLPGSSIAHLVSQTVSPGRSTSEYSSSNILSQSSSISVSLQSSLRARRVNSFSNFPPTTTAVSVSYKRTKLSETRNYRSRYNHPHPHDHCLPIMVVPPPPKPSAQIADAPDITIHTHQTGR